ncbi:MAG TPA: hypothetical protein VFG04_14885 [Planctomycetaceae bacterium]|jgi:hypothetical protein|nr:hypothetical protein [Planctomycetaceae bacterium]
MGELLIAWSARVVVAFYLLRLAADVLIADPVRRDRWARWAWTVGFAIYLVHVAFAFQFLHHWSHAAAVEHAARRTFEVVGFEFGAGLYFNYVFTLLWLADVVLWWRRSLAGRVASPAYYWTVQAIFAFMMFNATVVFGPAFWKWVAVGALAVIVALRLLLPRTTQLQIRES